MSAMASLISGVWIVYSTVCSGADQRKHQSSASLAFVRAIHRWPVNPAQRASNAENVSIWWCHHNNCLSFRDSLANGIFEWNFRQVSFTLISVIDGWGISCEICLRWLSVDLADNKSLLVQVMSWCQAAIHDLKQCWPSSMSPSGITRPNTT